MVTIVTRPDWPNVVTAIGTVAVAVVAVGVALFAEWRAGKRLRAEHQRSDKVLAEERALADKRLAEQRAHSDAQLAEERAAADKRLAEEIRAADKRLAEERQLAQGREQLAEAYAVRVLMGERPTGPPGDRKGRPVRLAAIVINHGRYPISGVDAQLRLAGGSPGLVPFEGQERVPGEEGLDPKLLGGMDARLEAMMHSSRLAPWDLGIRFESDPISTAQLPGAYPVVRWADRWGTHWEHRRGEVREIDEGEPWSP